MEEESESKQQEDAQVEGRWTKEEHQRFISAIMMHGKNWKLIQSSVETRNTSQVRSHAQKFFLKLIKIEKERKKNLKKGITTASRAEEDLIRTLSEQSFTSNTPTEILHFLKKDSKPPEDCKPARQIQLALEEQKKKEVIVCNEDDSFLMSLMKRNKNILNTDEGFTQLIDFPPKHEQQKEDEETSNKRKKSFSLYDEEEDEDKYNQTIRKVNGN